jgi:hypothetical protein
VAGALASSDIFATRQLFYLYHIGLLLIHRIVRRRKNNTRKKCNGKGFKENGQGAEKAVLIMAQILYREGVGRADQLRS